MIRRKYSCWRWNDNKLRWKIKSCSKRSIKFKENANSEIRSNIANTNIKNIRIGIMMIKKLMTKSKLNQTMVMDKPKSVLYLTPTNHINLLLILHLKKGHLIQTLWTHLGKKLKRKKLLKMKVMKSNPTLIHFYPSQNIKGHCIPS